MNQATIDRFIMETGASDAAAQNYLASANGNYLVRRRRVEFEKQQHLNDSTVGLLPNSLFPRLAFCVLCIRDSSSL